VRAKLSAGNPSDPKSYFLSITATPEVFFFFGLCLPPHAFTFQALLLHFLHSYGFFQGLCLLPCPPLLGLGQKCLHLQRRDLSLEGAVDEELGDSGAPVGFLRFKFSFFPSPPLFLSWLKVFPLNP